MSGAPFCWGILGVARITRSVIPAIRATPRHTLAAVASRELSRAEAYAAEWGIPSAYGSYEALLADAEIDAVYIPLPNHLHAPWAIAAAASGKHVLCEKPLALTTAEVDAIATAAARAGVVVTEAFMYRHHPQTLRVKQLLEDGVVGRVQLVRSAFTFTLTRTSDVRLDPVKGGGSLWDVGCYPVSMARYLLGREPVAAFGWQHTGASGVDLAFAGQLAFGDAVAQFDCGFQSPLRTHLEIVGSDACITVPVPFKPGTAERILLDRAGTVEAIEVAGPTLYLGELDDLADAAAGAPPRIRLQDSRGTVAAILALYESARIGRPVRL